MKSSKNIMGLAVSVFILAFFSGCGGERQNITEDKLGGDKVISTIAEPSEDSENTERTDNDSTSDAEAEDKSSEPSQTENSVLRTKEPSYKCSLVCVGDNLIHDNIYKEALKNGGGEKYDFTKAYEHIEKYIKGTDIAIINQETLVTDKYEPSSYPMFASPLAVGDKAVDLGFNVVSMCNNHVLDKGADGLISSLDYWDTKDVIHYGAYRNEADSEDIRIKEVNGIKFAFLGYMEHTNGMALNGDEGKVIYLKEEEKIKSQIERADKLADVVVVSCHYGTEISNELNHMQVNLTPKLVEWGADLIIGTQAHALSTCGYLDKPDGTKAFVYYGLGNFFSTMYDTKSLVGIMGKLNVVKDPDSGKISFENVKAIPVISHFEAYQYDSDWYNCAVYPYKDYTDDLFAKNFVEGFSRETVEQCLSYVPKEFLSIE